MIEVKNFTKRYGEFVAVDDLSFSIGKGEIFGFIGPNGAGKSTTIRFLATLLRPTSGQGFIAGHSVVDDPMAVRRVIGFMPDDFGVYDGMKVWEFLDFFAVAYQIPRSHRKQIIGQVLELLDLTHKRDDYVNGLSKGMKQRLCLAKTLVHDPPVLILDEPASGLDPRARLEMKALLNELKGMGKTILVSSHILSELADFCTMIGIIERGKLLAAGNISDITRQVRQHRVLKVRVTDVTTDHAASILRNEPRCRSLESFDHTLTCEYEGEEADLSRLLNQLIVAGVGVHSFAEGRIELGRGVHDDHKGDCELKTDVGNGLPGQSEPPQIAKNRRAVVPWILLAIFFNVALITCFRSSPKSSSRTSSEESDQQLWMELCLPQEVAEGTKSDRSSAYGDLARTIESLMLDSEFARLCRRDLGFDINAEGQPVITVSRPNNGRFITMTRSYNNTSEDMKVLNVIAHQLAAWKPKPLVKVVRRARFHDHEVPSMSEQFSEDDKSLMRTVFCVPLVMLSLLLIFAFKPSNGSQRSVE